MNAQHVIQIVFVVIFAAVLLWPLFTAKKERRFYNEK